MSEQDIFVIVRVRLEEGAELHQQDADEDGLDAIGGIYGFRLKSSDVASHEVEGDEDPAVELALDIFHDEIAIKILDNYDISAERIESFEAAPEDTDWR